MRGAYSLLRFVSSVTENDEINAFIPEEYWSLEGDFQVKGEKKPLQAKFYGTDKKMDIHSKEEMDKLLASLKIKNMRSMK